MGFANFSEEGHQPGGGPLDRFDMRGLIIFLCNGDTAATSLKTVHLTLVSQDYIAGAGAPALF